MTLTDDEVDAQLPDDWDREGDEIVRTYEFDDYLTGVSFATISPRSPTRSSTTPN